MADINMTGRRGIIFGVANERSIAWHIAKRLSEAGAEMAFTYLNDRLKRSVAKLTDPLGAMLVECDATEETQIQSVCDTVGSAWDSIDFVVHSIAYADRDDLVGRFSNVSRQGFRTALEASAYTLIPVVKHAALLMKNGGAALTMTFDASVRVYPGYNIMGTAKAALENAVRQLSAEYGPQGVRVNAVSAGPLPTLAARSIPGFGEMRGMHQEKAPLRRNVTHQEVADASLFMLSDMSSGITGAILPVDAGYGIVAA